MTAYRILLVDDHVRLRELYKIALVDDPDLTVVAEADDGASGAKLAAEFRPDLVVLDLSMPNRDGLQALQEIKRVLPEARVLVLSGFLRDRVEPLVLELGANAYMEKGLPMREIPRAFRSVAEALPRAPARPMPLDELTQRLRELV